jgi:hypothetical protein
MEKTMIGQLAKIIKKQTDRVYFSNIPIGTHFIIIDIHDNMPAYELTGYFIGIEPKILSDETPHFTGYIEKGSWELVGNIVDNIGAFLIKG